MTARPREVQSGMTEQGPVQKSVGANKQLDQIPVAGLLVRSRPQELIQVTNLPRSTSTTIPSHPSLVLNPWRPFFLLDPSQAAALPSSPRRLLQRRWGCWPASRGWSEALVDLL